MRGVRHIAESANEIEIAEVADGRHFSNVCLHFRLCVVRVDGMYAWCIVNDRVATVDALVEALPCGETIGFEDVLLENLIEVVARTRTICEVVATHFTPNQHAIDAIVGFELSIATVHHAVHVGFFRPVVLQHNIVQRNNAQKIIASRENEE